MARGVALCLGVGLGVATVACSPRESLADVFVRDLTNAVAELKPDGKIVIADLRVGHWTSLYIFPPYTSDAQVAATLAAAGTESVNTHKVAERDDINLLVFVDRATSHLVVAMPRRLVDFSMQDAHQPLTPSTATFKRLPMPGVVLGTVSP